MKKTFVELKYSNELSIEWVGVLEATISKFFSKRGAWINKSKCRFIIREELEVCEEEIAILKNESEMGELKLREIDIHDETLTEEEKSWMMGQ